MASLYECEVRYTITDIRSFTGTLQKLGARLAYPYAFTDHYFVPGEKTWDPLDRNRA